MFKCVIAVLVTGKDKAFQGMLDLDLPFAPYPSLEIESLYSAEPLILDVVAYDALAQDFTCWCLPIQSDQAKARTMMRRFAGNWDWEEVEVQECEECEGGASSDAQKATDEANDIIRRIIQKRAGDLPANPRDAEKN